jgi:type I restriction enzyme S subunit
MPVVIPQNSIVNEFDNVISSYFRKIENNDNESRRLSELRDTLLPKLMSGELKVTNMDLVNEMLEKGIR